MLNGRRRFAKGGKVVGLSELRVSVVARGRLPADADDLADLVRGHGPDTSAIVEFERCGVRFDMISEQKCDETKPTSPTHCLWMATFGRNGV